MLFSCTNEDLVGTDGGIAGMSGSLEVPDHSLHPGVYYVVMALFEGMEPILRQLIGEIKVESNGVPHFGVYDVEHQWAVQLLSPHTEMAD